MKTNKWAVAAVIGAATAVAFAVLRGILGRLFYALIEFSDTDSLWFWTSFVALCVAMVACGFVYCNYVCKWKIPLISWIPYGAAAGLVYTSLLENARAAILSYLVSFIVVTAAVLVAFRVWRLLPVDTEKEAAFKEWVLSRVDRTKYYPSFWIIAIVGYVLFVAISVCVYGFVEEWDFGPGTILRLVFTNMLLSVLYTYVYFLPYLIANKKAHRQTRAIYVLNIFAGWTVLAWLIALIWAFVESGEKTVIQQAPPASTADELMKYKSLLDAGAITQEEFETKKKQLLQQ